MSNLEDALDADYAEAWKPSPGERREIARGGLPPVVDVADWDADTVPGDRPIVTLRAADGEREVLARHLRTLALFAQAASEAERADAELDAALQ
jgi:hypothetical protein